MSRNKYRLCKVVAAVLIVFHFLCQNCNGIMCPAYPIGIFGSDDILYTAIAISADSQLIVGGSCKDSLICASTAPYPAPIVKKFSMTSFFEDLVQDILLELTQLHLLNFTILV